MAMILLSSLLQLTITFVTCQNGHQIVVDDSGLFSHLVVDESQLVPLSKGTTLAKVFALNGNISLRSDSRENLREFLLSAMLCPFRLVSFDNKNEQNIHLVAFERSKVLVQDLFNLNQPLSFSKHNSWIIIINNTWITKIFV